MFAYFIVHLFVSWVTAAVMPGLGVCVCNLFYPMPMVVYTLFTRNF